MKRFLFLLVISSIFIFSCKKDKLITAPQVPVKMDYFQPKVGSYWIYEWYDIDTFGIETSLNIFDTITNTGVTTINDKEYVVQSRQFQGANVPDVLLRDSLGYIVDSNGEIHFSYVNFSDTLHTSSIPQVDLEIYRKMNDEVLAIGINTFYVTLEAETILYGTPGSSNTICDGTVSFSENYVQDIGMVKQTKSDYSQVLDCNTYQEGRLYYHFIP